MKRPLALALIIALIFSFFACIAMVEGETSEPEIAVIPIASLGPTDRWHVIVTYPDDSPPEDFYIEGTKSEPLISNTQQNVLETTTYETQGKRIVQQDILMGFSYTWDYQLKILGRTFDVFKFSLDIGFPVRMKLQYLEPMIGGVLYPVQATLIPLDCPDFNEFTCNFEVIGYNIFDASQSLVTPIGSENAWTPFEIGPFFFWNGIPFVLFTLDVGLAVVPQLFSDRVEAIVGVSGDASLQSSDLLLWNAPDQMLQFNVLAEDISPLNYASILLSQFEYYLSALLIGFNVALRANWIWGGSSQVNFRLFTLDASRLLPMLSFGVHPSSPASSIQANVPVVALARVIPEVSIGTIMASASMIIALAAYVAIPRIRRVRG